MVGWGRGGGGGGREKNPWKEGGGKKGIMVSMRGRKCGGGYGIEVCGIVDNWRAENQKIKERKKKKQIWKFPVVT